MDVLPCIFEWFKSQNLAFNRPWLILGKGPSFSEYSSEDASNFQIITLNDVIREVSSADLAHFIDLEAFERCADQVSKARIVIMPWFPHIGNKPSKINLSQIAINHPALNNLAKQNRLCWYNLSTSSAQQKDSPVVNAKYFSAEAVLEILAMSGVRKIRSLGLDGGVGYSEQFSDLFKLTHLTNNQKSFEPQFSSFSQTILRTDLDYSPLNIESPIRIFIACSDSEMLPAKILEYSIRLHASCTVEITYLADININIPVPRDPHNHPRTPFSFQRFLIPQICGYSGRAIYLDSDMLVFKDISNLWRRPFCGANVLTAFSSSSTGRIPQNSVMLMDCQRLQWNIEDIVNQLDSNKVSYEELMYQLSIANVHPEIEPDWNSLEYFKEEKTALLHYTDMNIQPWVSHLNPLSYLWIRVLIKAIDEGFVTRDFLEEQVLKGHVRPSLIYQINHRIEDSILLSKKIIMLDREFNAPYRALHSHDSSPWKNRFRWIYSAVKSKFRETSAYKFNYRIIRKFRSYLNW
jgi:lipopolysaccharide biosynthesis glycosyltransferase